MNDHFDPRPAPPEPALRVFVVAQSPALRAGLRALLEGEPGIVVSGEGGSLPLAFDGAHFDVLVADVSDDDTAAEFEDEPFGAGPAVLLGDWDAADNWLAPTPGPRGYLPHESTGAELAAAVRAVAAGLTVFAPGLAARFAPTPAAATSEVAATGDAVLTEREREVLELLALGLPNKGIARQLGVSEHTAKFHVGTILAKLGAASRTEAVVLAARRGLLPL